MNESRWVPVHVRLAIANWPEDAARGAVAEFCRQHGLSRSWFYELRKLAAREGPLGLTTRRSSAPARQAARTSPEIEALAVQIRAKLLSDGGYEGPISVRHVMLSRGVAAPSRATLARIFTRAGVVEPSPKKKPKSRHRFAYPAPNACWQLDGFDVPLANGTIATALQTLDDHSRRIVGSHAASGETTVDVQAVLATAIIRVGVPQRFLSDNGAALNPTRRGRRGIVETWLRAQGVQVIASTPGHPQTTGKAERHHQTCQRWLGARPAAASLDQLQDLLDQFEDYYNHRPHQSLGMLTPMQAWAATPVAIPPPRPATSDDHHDRAGGAIITRTANAKGLAYFGSVKIMLGVEHAHATVLGIFDNDTIHVWDRDGIHLRTITVRPGTTYYGNGRRPGRPR